MADCPHGCTTQEEHDGHQTEYSRDLMPWELEPHYSRHVEAMTREGLHHKTDIAEQLAVRDQQIERLKAPIPMLLRCPACNWQHVDRGEWATRPHRTHQCKVCRHEWRPANVCTVGVLELPERDALAKV